MAFFISIRTIISNRSKRREQEYQHHQNKCRCNSNQFENLRYIHFIPLYLPYKRQPQQLLQVFRRLWQELYNLVVQLVWQVRGMKHINYCLNYHFPTCQVFSTASAPLSIRGLLIYSQEATTVIGDSSSLVSGSFDLEEL